MRTRQRIYCSEEVVAAMIAHLDGPEDIVLRNYTIPRAIAFRDNYECIYGKALGRRVIK
jgi:hypothetical protein